MENNTPDYNVQERLGAIFPWFRNACPLGKIGHGSTNPVYEIEGGIVVKVVPKPRKWAGISHEAHTLRCLAEASCPGLIIPRLVAVDHISDPNLPFDHVIRMTKLNGEMPIGNNRKYNNQVTLPAIGRAIGRLHLAFDQVAKGENRLREREAFKISDELEKRNYALKFALEHLPGQKEKLCKAESRMERTTWG